MTAKTGAAKTETVVEIPYVKYAIMPEGRKKASDYRYVTHDDLDTWTFENFVENGMYESLKMQKFRRLYFDFDFKTEDKDIAEKANKCYEWLCELEDTFDLCALCGYCTDENIHKALKIALRRAIELKKDLKCDKVLGFHAIFYNTCMDANELCDIMKNDKYNVAIRGFLGKAFDTSVYETVGSEQLFRHPYANKYMRENTYSRKEKKGVNPATLKHPYKASELIATPRGDERIVTKSEWLKVFSMIEQEEQPVPKQAESAKEPQTTFTTPDDADLPEWMQYMHNVYEEEKQIISPEEVVKDLDKRYAQSENHMTKEMFDALVKGFKGLEIHADFASLTKEITLDPLFGALYACECDQVDNDDINDAINDIKDNNKLTGNAAERWTKEKKRVSKDRKEKPEKAIKTPGALFIYLKTFNPKYFNKHIRPMISKKKAEAVLEAKFDLKDSFTIKDIRMKGVAGEYQKDGDAEKLDYDAVLYDLHRVMLVVDQGSGIFYFKAWDALTKMMKTELLKRADAFDKLRDIKVGTELKQKQYRKGEEHQLVDKSAFDVYVAGKNNASFYKNSTCFYSEDPEDFSFFQGYKYEPVQNDELIQPFLDHIKNIWCNDDEKLYNYVQTWFATILSHPLAKTQVGLVIKGAQGTGKNTVTDAWCELLAGYSNPNADIDATAGKYTGGIPNKKLNVYNELNGVEVAPKTMYSNFKKQITEPIFDLHLKFMNIIPNQQNVLNCVFTSNEFNPIQIEPTDRRYCVIKPNEEHRNDKAYFKPLYASMKTSPARYAPYRKDFMEALTYYYTTYKIEIDVTDIPDTEEKQSLMDMNRPFTHYFIAKHMDELGSKYGVQTADAYDLYERDFREFGYGVKIQRNKFQGCMSAEYCKYKQIEQPDGTRPRCLQLTTDKKMLKQLEELKSLLPKPSIDLSAVETPEDKKARLLEEFAALPKELQEQIKQLM